MQNAVEKAQDYLSVVGQKVGKVQSISDTAVSESPRPFYNSKMMAMQADGAPRETLAAGEGCSRNFSCGRIGIECANSGEFFCWGIID